MERYTVIDHQPFSHRTLQPHSHPFIGVLSMRSDHGSFVLIPRLDWHSPIPARSIRAEAPFVFALHDNIHHLIGAMHTYAQFTDLVFRPLPAQDGYQRFDSIIGDHGDTAFCPFVDDHQGAATTFDGLFDFLHDGYFPRVAFGPVYLLLR